MEIYSLISFTVCFLNLIINMYNSREIDRNTFYNISKLKIKFLEDSIFNIPSLEEKNKILSVLDNCKKICSYLESEPK
jgi:hypothetical protein